MYLNDSLETVIHAVDVMVAESMQVACALRIVHRFRPRGAVNCLPGEEVFAAFLLYRGRAYQLRLSLSARLLLDYLPRHPPVPQSPPQIPAAIHTSAFFPNHAMTTLHPH